MVPWHDIASSAIIVRNRLITTTNPYSAFLFYYHSPLYKVLYRPNLAIHLFLSSSEGHLSGFSFFFILFWQIIQPFVVVARRIRAVREAVQFPGLHSGRVRDGRKREILVEETKRTMAAAAEKIIGAPYILEEATIWYDQWCIQPLLSWKGATLPDDKKYG